MLQIRIVPSIAAVTNRVSVELNDTDESGEPFPAKTREVTPDTAFPMRPLPSLPAVATSAPSCDMTAPFIDAAIGMLLRRIPVPLLYTRASPSSLAVMTYAPLLLN